MLLTIPLDLDLKKKEQVNLYNLNKTHTLKNLTKFE